MASVFTGAAVAQAVPFLGALVIARLYLPTEFGLFSTWLGISAVLTVCLTFRLEHAFGLERDGGPRDRVVLGTLVLVLLAGLVFLCLTIVAVLAGFSYAGMSVWLLLLLTPMAVGAAFCQVWQSWAANNGQVRYLSYMRIWQATSVTVLQIAIGWVRPGALELALAQVIGTWVAVVASSILIPSKPALLRVMSRPYTTVRSTLLRYKRFATLSLPADLINVVAAQMPLVVLTSRFGAEVAGLYALTTKMMGAPISLLGTAVRDVFKRSANEEFRQTGSCIRTYLKTFVVLGVASLLMVIVLYPLAEWLFVTLFGEKWRESGVMAIWLLPLFALRFLASPLSYTLYVVQKQNVDLAWQVGLLAMTVATLFPFSTFKSTLICYGAAYAVMYAIYIYLSFRCSKKQT